MKTGPLTAAFMALSLISIEAGPTNLIGEYADKEFLNGQAVFQLGVEQQGESISISFTAGYNDGHGAAPEADGKGKLTGKGGIDFTWEDGFNNSGIGTISPSGNGVIVSIKTTRVADLRCLAFYKQNIRLNRIKK